MAFYEKTTLPGGIRVMTETIPHVRSASVGVWVGAGSCWESPTDMGMSHFIEHMVFKGTKTRTAKEIARAIDGRGGSLNAFTAKENTCYYAKVLDRHLDVAVDVLADMLQHSLWDSLELEKEKGVILDEIRMYEDDPDDLVHDRFTARLFADHPLGRPIMGTAETVSSFTREQLTAYYATHYTPDHVVVAVAGNVTHQAVVELVSERFTQLSGQRSASFPAPPVMPTGNRLTMKVKPDSEQLHIVLGTAGLHQDHPEAYALHLVNTVFGGGPSSRLFQAVREDRGLAYSVYSFTTSYRDAGAFGIYAGCNPAQFEQVMDVLQAEVEQLADQGLTAEELAEAKEQLKGQLMLGLESTSGRMTRLGRGELMLGRVLSPDQIIARIDGVTLEQTRAVSRRLLSQPRVVSLVGPRAELDVARYGFDPAEIGGQ